MKRYHLEFSGTLESLGEVADFIQQACHAVKAPLLPDDFIRNILLVSSEAVTNAIRHGTRFEGEPLSVTVEVSDELFSLRVLDHGPGFDLETVAAPNLDQPAEGGYGIFIIKSLMDDVSYVRGDDANALVMIKRFGRE
jgi:anti-sigma regulatory factor (Ser/Thr protein kinase)